MAETDEGAADRRVIMRRALAGEIGKEGDARRRLQRVAKLGGELGGRLARHMRMPVERIGRRQDDAHLVPGVGQRVAEGMDSAFRLRQVGAVGRKEHARRPERNEGGAVADRAHAAGRGRIVPCPAGNDGIAGNTPFRGQLAAQLAGNFGAFDQRRHLPFIEIGRGQQLRRPFALACIEPGGAGGVRHFRHVLARQPQTQIVLRQQHPAHFGEDIRLVLGNPCKLRRREAGEDDVAGQSTKARIGVKRGSLMIAARVVPEDAGAQHLVVGVEQRRAMHLAGQADAANRCQLLGMRGLQSRNGFLGRANPVCRVLLGPAWMRARDIEVAMGGTDDLLIAVDQHRFDARRSEIETQIH